MASCKDCLHVDVCCSYLSTAYNKCKLATPDFKLLKNIECDECQHYKDRSRFVELPYPMPVGYKLSYIYTDEDGKIKVGENYEVVTRVCESGFYVSGWLNSDGIYREEDCFYTWSAIGDEFFLTREAAEQALKERGENENV